MGQGGIRERAASNEVRYLAEKRIKAVLFDVGDTLLNFGRVRTMEVFRRSARLTYDYLKSLGQPVGDFGRYCLRNLIAVRLRVLWAGVTGRDFDALSLLKRSGVRHGYNLTEEQWREIGWLWYKPLGDLAEVELDLKDTLASLRRMGLKFGILSNTFISAGSLDRHLAQLGLLDFFPCRLYSYQFEFRKPDRRIFEAAAARMGEPAENILFVGDRIDKDIRPALKIGMSAALKAAYTNADKKAPQGVWRISRIAELPELIGSIGSSKPAVGPGVPKVVVGQQNSNRSGGCVQKVLNE